MTSSREEQLVLLYTLHKKGGKSSDERAISFILEGKLFQERPRDEEVVSTGETRIANRIRFACADLKILGEFQKRAVGEKGVWRLSDAGREHLFRVATKLYRDKTTGIQAFDGIIWERFTPEFLVLLRKLGEERSAADEQKKE